MDYDAFISYRHTPLDMEFAKKVHSSLETFHVPKAVQKKTGKKKIKRVFRDQEELPIGSDLNDNITKALTGSEYLIVICSPETPGSYWVCKEIDTFIALHDREHILAVLVDGEPSDSFPPQLLVDDNGNPVEPLAADIRGASSGERNKKYKTEFLRLAAPILGCTYDDLKQRNRERIMKRNLTIVGLGFAIIATAGTAFGVYQSRVADKMGRLADEKALLADEKTALANDKSKLADEKSELADEMSELAKEKTALAEEIAQQYDEKQQNQSRFYAEEALSVLKQGNREDAALIALEALPSKDNNRPYVAEAERALAEILHAYDNGQNLEYDRTLSHDFNVVSEVLSEDMSRLITIDNGNNVYVWDTETWELLAKIMPSVSEDNYVVTVESAYADADGIYLTTDGLFTKYDYSGSIVYTANCEGTWGSIVSTELQTAFVISGKAVTILDISDGSERAVIESKSDTMFSGKYALSEDKKQFAVAQNSTADDVESRVVIINTDNLKAKTCKLVQSYTCSLCFTDSGNVAAVTCNSTFLSAGIDKLKLELVSATDEDKGWEKTIPTTIESLAQFEIRTASHSFEDESDIVVTINNRVFTYREKDGKQKNSLYLASIARTLDLNPGSSTGFIGYENGNIESFNFDEGYIYTDSSIVSNVALTEMVIMSGKVGLRAEASNNIWILKYHTPSDLEDLGSTDFYGYGEIVSQDGEIFVVADSRNANHLSFYDSKGTLLYTFEEEELQPIGMKFYGSNLAYMEYNYMWLIDPVNGKAEKVDYDPIGLESFLTSVNFSDNGKYAVLWGSKTIAVIDIESGKFIFTTKTESNVGNCSVDNEGAFVYASCTGKNLIKISTGDGSETEFSDDSLRAFSDYYRLKYTCLSPNGKYLVMYCNDGNARVVDTGTCSVLYTYPFSAQRTCFFGFSEDSEYVFMQGEDLILQIFSLKDGSFVSSFSGLFGINYTVNDSDGYVAFCDGQSTVLVETKKYGTIAYAAMASHYLHKDNAFILYNGRSINKTYYKNYEKLINEVALQFPGAELTEQEKSDYNIE